jgi:hypothetical protein
MTDYAVRFFVGGAVVSIFALLGDVLRPKSFAGLFGAAPSVALVSLALAICRHGPDYVSTLAAWMMAGATALLVFCFVTCHLLKRTGLSVLSVTLLGFPLWLVVAFGLYGMVG